MILAGLRKTNTSLWLYSPWEMPLTLFTEKRVPFWIMPIAEHVKCGTKSNLCNTREMLHYQNTIDYPERCNQPCCAPCLPYTTPIVFFLAGVLPQNRRKVWQGSSSSQMANLLKGRDQKLPLCVVGKLPPANDKYDVAVGYVGALLGVEMV